MKLVERSNGQFTHVSKTLCLALLFISSLANPEDFTSRVVGITNGDTLTFLPNGRREKMRLNGVDTRRGIRLLEYGPENVFQVWRLGKKQRSESQEGTATGEPLQM
jgi:hypothetical protein